MSDADSASADSSSVAGPIVHAVRVDANLNEHLLKVSPRTLRVKPGDSILWQFSGLQFPWTPLIALSHDYADGYLGPFTSITNLPSGVLAPVAAEAVDQVYSYRARMQILRGKGEARASLLGPESSIVVDHQAQGTRHQVDVGLGVDPESGEEILTVSQERVGFSLGDSVVWRFSDEIFESCEGSGPLPIIQFQDHEGHSQVANLRTGPFNCLTYGTREVTGTSPNGVPGLYHYQVAMVDAQHGEIRWISSSDPAVDERPEPPPTRTVRGR